ncbi:MAG: hypothetical protein WC489_04420 [Patescibacteria group bacterium]
MNVYFIKKYGILLIHMEERNAGRQICNAVNLKAGLAAVAAVPSFAVALLTTPGTVFEPMIQQYLQLSSESTSQMQDVSLAVLFGVMTYALLAPAITAKLSKKVDP